MELYKRKVACSRAQHAGSNIDSKSSAIIALYCLVNFRNIYGTPLPPTDKYTCTSPIPQTVLPATEITSQEYSTKPVQTELLILWKCRLKDLIEMHEIANFVVRYLLPALKQRKINRALKFLISPQKHIVCESFPPKLAYFKKFP